MRLLTIPLICATLLLGGWTAFDWTEVAAVATGTVPDAWVAADLNTGLIAIWAMRTNTSTTVVTDEYGTNTGVIVGSPAFGAAYGVRDAGVLLNGSSQYISEVDAWFDGSVSNSLTIGGWFKPANLTELGVGIFVKYDITSNQRSFRLFSSQGKLVAQFGASNGTFQGEYSSTAVVLTSNVWAHVALVYGGSEVKLFVNGLSVSGSVISGTIPSSLFNSTSPFRVGYAVNNAYFPGSVDEVAIWNRALSSNEVFQIYNTPLYAQYKQ
jgi:hypothetical protein